MEHVVVVGAGPAGLAAAYKLLKEKESEVEVTVLEATSAIGGISRTVNHQGNRMDLGGHRFFSKSDEVMDFWLDLLPLQGVPSVDDLATGVSANFSALERGPDPSQVDEVMLERKRVSRIYYLRKFFDYPISISPQTFLNLGFKRTWTGGIGYMGAMVHKLPEDNLENFYINRFGRGLYEMFFEDYTTKVWGKHPSEISADWGAQRVKGLSLMRALGHAIAKPFRALDMKIKKRFGQQSDVNEALETSLIEQFYYPKHGPGQLWETLAQRVEELGGKILMKQRVVEIETEENTDGSPKVTGVVTQDGTRYPVDALFSSMPIKDLVEALDEEIVPAELRRIAINLPYRDFMTVGLLVDELKLENESGIPTYHGGVPDNWIYIQERDVRIGRLQIFNNWSPYMVVNPKDQLFIGLEYFCNEGDEFWTMSDEDFIALAIEELERIDILDPAKVRDSVRLRVPKAYPAYFGSYEDFPKLQEFLMAMPNLYCIGRNGQHRYNNMDHSVLTAFRGAEAYLTGDPVAKEAMWNVNTEQEYHEGDER